MFKCAHKSPLIVAPKVQFGATAAKYSAKMHCPFWNTGISNSVTVRLFCHLFAHISFFDKDERQPHEFHIGCFFCITPMISKISIAYFFSLECQPLT